MGQPINHSTHSGFNFPPATSDSAGPAPYFSRLPWLVGRLSFVVGVGHFVTASTNVSPVWIPDGGALLRFAVELRVFLESA